ncbi:MAG TPA: flavodoxin family protein, partial [Thermoanaerobaculia bacterium]|nr:flavodoxin family protein [Thermoanaerobaculia bacterium]
MPLSERQEALCESHDWDFSHLTALYVNCTLKRSPRLSHTEGLMRLSMEIMERNGVAVDSLRAVDHDIAYGVYGDMTEHGWESDEWPELFAR